MIIHTKPSSPDHTPSGPYTATCEECGFSVTGMNSYEVSYEAYSHKVTHARVRREAAYVAGQVYIQQEFRYVIPPQYEQYIRPPEFNNYSLSY